MIIVSPLYRFSFLRGSQRGMSMIELLVTMGIVALMTALAIPKLNKSMLNLPVAVQTLLADLRMARANAVSRGAHYRVSLTPSSYSVQCLQDDDGDGVWQPDGRYPTQTVPLPKGISLSFAHESSKAIEFTTRGLLADQEDGSPAEIVTIHCSDAQKSDETQTIEVWPSGQVEEI